jgi:hypothetical protein
MAREVASMPRRRRCTGRGLRLSAWLVLGSVLAPVVLAPSPARAADSAASARAAARRLVVEGDGFYARQDHARALDRYQAAYELMHVPTVGIEVMKAQKALGQLLEANATALEVAALPQQPGEPAVFDQARLEAARAGLRLGSLIPTLWLDVAPRGVVYKVEIDGKAPQHEAPFQLNPGAHQVRLSAPGFQTLELKVTLLEAERQTLSALLYAEPAAASAVAPPRAPEPVVAVAPMLSAQPATPGKVASGRADAGHTLGWVGVSVAGVAAAVGTFAGVSAWTQKPDCPNNLCAPDQQGAIDDSERLGIVANVSFGVALVAGVLGIWQLASGSAADPSAREDRSEPPLTLVGSGPGRLRLQLSGSF